MYDVRKYISSWRSIFFKDNLCAQSLSFFTSLIFLFFDVSLIFFWKRSSRGQLILFWRHVDAFRSVGFIAMSWTRNILFSLLHVLALNFCLHLNLNLEITIHEKTWKYGPTINGHAGFPIRIFVISLDDPQWNKTKSCDNVWYLLPDVIYKFMCLVHLGTQVMDTPGTILFYFPSFFKIGQRILPAPPRLYMLVASLIREILDMPLVISQLRVNNENSPLTRACKFP